LAASCACARARLPSLWTSSTRPSCRHSAPTGARSAEPTGRRLNWRCIWPHSGHGLAPLSASTSTRWRRCFTLGRPIWHMTTDHASYLPRLTVVPFLQPRVRPAGPGAQTRFGSHAPESRSLRAIRHTLVTSSNVLAGTAGSLPVGRPSSGHSGAIASAARQAGSIRGTHGRRTLCASGGRADSNSP
jgi:hypothetical protein